MKKITIEINNPSECPCCIQMKKQVEFQQMMKSEGFSGTTVWSWRCVVTEEIVNPEIMREK